MKPKELKERIAELEEELKFYKQIAETYRAALGDVKANTILAMMPRRRDRRKEPQGDWKQNWQAQVVAVRQMLAVPPIAVKQETEVQG